MGATFVNVLLCLLFLIPLNLMSQDEAKTTPTTEPTKTPSTTTVGSNTSTKNSTTYWQNEKFFFNSVRNGVDDMALTVTMRYAPGKAIKEGQSISPIDSAALEKITNAFAKEFDTKIRPATSGMQSWLFYVDYNYSGTDKNYSFKIVNNVNEDVLVKLEKITEDQLSQKIKEAHTTFNKVLKSWDEEGAPYCIEFDSKGMTVANARTVSVLQTVEMRKKLKAADVNFVDSSWELINSVGETGRVKRICFKYKGSPSDLMASIIQNVPGLKDVSYYEERYTRMIFFKSFAPGS